MSWWETEDQCEDITKPKVMATEPQVDFLRRHWDQLRPFVNRPAYEQGPMDFLRKISKAHASWLMSEVVNAVSISDGSPPDVKKVTLANVPVSCGTCVQANRNTKKQCNCEWPSYWPTKAAACPGYVRDKRLPSVSMDSFEALRGKRCLVVWPDGSYAIAIPMDVIVGEGVMVKMGGEVYEIEFSSGADIVLLEG